ncbi:hypothetical protein LAZ67_1002893 [Cordylochernes scorpioides]|uniref:Peptidase C1A papain C-terminal domain-containing protein n=1 Tax=Cordylochernes scorpioides TaxID=51811 RepID=A0ABY6JWF3_9ARAC|nr:hypothetical protein LAZ67_1002893 [Cordylochernes scorpioides]
MESSQEVTKRMIGLIGYVTEVKDQGHCGSCWAFSVVGTLEGQHYRKSGKLVSLSEQNLVDCSYANYSCNGGDMVKAYEYIIKNGGIDTEDSYRYNAKDKCDYKKANIGATCKGYKRINQDEESLKQALAAVGPISIGINSAHATFQIYKGGVYNNTNCQNDKDSIDHGLLLVSYGQENGMDYWLVKNSWGDTWGENGYIKMSRNKNNQCGIATYATYPIV